MAARDTHSAAALPITTRLNLAIAVAGVVLCVGALWVASHASGWPAILLAAIVFSFVNNTVFSLLHECVHGTFHSSPRVNEMAGALFAAFFPTAFSIQRASHFGHHRRNRSDLELYDYVLPHQSWWLKTYWLYCLLTGFYWAIIPVAGLAYVICPLAFRSRWFQAGPARWWGFEPFVRDIADQPIRRVWCEAAFTVVFQVTLAVSLDLTLLGWLACYWAFALNWCSLQYTDHAWSPRHTHEGAWNLRFWPLTQALFLNYNFHLVHHRQPEIPWFYLPRFARVEDPDPSFWSIYWTLWAGAKPVPDVPPPVANAGAARTALPIVASIGKQ